MDDGGAEIERIVNAFGETVFRRMLRGHQEHAAELDVTLLQAQALRLLRDESMGAGRLAAELGITPPAVTQLTDRLRRKRLVERREADGDRRTVLVGLTPEGERAVDSFRERRNELFASALGRMSERDRATVLGSIAKLTAAMGGLGADDVGTNRGSKGPANTQEE